MDKLFANLWLVVLIGFGLAAVLVAFPDFANAAGVGAGLADGGPARGSLVRAGNCLRPRPLRPRLRVPPLPGAARRGAVLLLLRDRIRSWAAARAPVSVADATARAAINLIRPS